MNLKKSIITIVLGVIVGSTLAIASYKNNDDYPHKEWVNNWVNSMWQELHRPFK